MKKVFLMLALIPLVAISCKPKQNAEEEVVTPETEQASTTGNPYVSETEAQDATVVEENLSGEVVSLTASQFSDQITEINNPKGFSYKGRTPCIVDFYAEWCGPCMQMKPVMEALAKKYKGEVIIYKLNVDKAQDICEAFGIQNIPTFMFFSRTEQPRKMVGAMSKSEMDAAIRDFIGE
ncbi:MAG: thioredoxin [Bacteroidales bacterium]|nr:thioredoxin [Bacteroidales bacterium]